jgi:integrase
MSKKTRSSKKHTFAKPSTQAKRVCVDMFKSRAIASIGTSRNYADGLARFGEWLRDNRCGPLDQAASISRAERFLAERAKAVGQKTLDRDRQAVEALLRHNGKLDERCRLPMVRSEKQQVLKPRAYSPDQVHAIKARMAPHNQLGMEIAHAAGLRAHELFTLARLDEATADERKADPSKFLGLENFTRYLTTGKGGLTREVAIPNRLAERLEALRLDEPRTRRDREILYQQRYGVGGGRALSQSFTDASKAALGYSTGLHGLRHSYAQQRHFELQLLTGDPEKALEVVSQELGHFRPQITEVYLR